jgi:hypothetical protein
VVPEIPQAPCKVANASSPIRTIGVGLPLREIAVDRFGLLCLGQRFLIAPKIVQGIPKGLERRRPLRARGVGLPMSYLVEGCFRLFAMLESGLKSANLPKGDAKIVMRGGDGGGIGPLC